MSLIVWKRTRISLARVGTALLLLAGIAATCLHISLPDPAPVPSIPQEKRPISRRELLRIAEDLTAVRGVLKRRHVLQGQATSSYNHATEVVQTCRSFIPATQAQAGIEQLQRLSNRRQRRLYEHLFYNDDMEIIYCTLQKVASHNWRSVFLSLKDKLRQPPSYYLHSYRNNSRFKSLAVLTKLERFRRLNTYYKFVMVRHPANRLVSLYLDKFYKLARSPDFIERFGRKVKKLNRQWKKYNARVSSNFSSGNEGFSYADIVRFVASQKPDDMNEHWTPMVELCRPCEVRYDFVAKLEEAPESAAAMMAAVGMPKEVAFPGRNASVEYNHRAVDNAAVVGMNSQLTIAEHMLVHTVYSDDYRVFNYSKLAYPTHPP